VQVVVGQHPSLQVTCPWSPWPGIAIKCRCPWLDRRWHGSCQPMPRRSGRETDEKKQTLWYADYVARNFSDLNALAKPLPKPRN
jgi:hypothetical protein